MKISKKPGSITLVTKRKLQLLFALLLSSCFAKKGDEQIITGKWINTSMSNIEMPFLYDFRDGDKVYITYLNGLVSKRNIEFLDGKLLISSDKNINYFEKFVVSNLQEDLITFKNSNGLQIKLIPLESISAKFVGTSELKEELLKENWKMSFSDDLKENNGIVEFYRNGKYLFTNDSDEGINSFVFKWSVHKIDSLTVVVFTDVRPHLFLIENMSPKRIFGGLFISDGESNPISFERIENKDNREIMTKLKGLWKLNYDADSNSIPVAIEFELQNDFMGYYMNTESGGVLSYGSWNLSKSGDVIVLDKLKEGNRSVINIVNIYDKKLTINYKGTKLEYSKIQNPI